MKDTIKFCRYATAIPRQEYFVLTDQEYRNISKEKRIIKIIYTRKIMPVFHVPELE